MNSNEKDTLFQKGLESFNSRQFYDAHEHWEEVWLETPNPDKMFLQGLIQVAAAFHHFSRENHHGTKNLLLAGVLKLDRFPGKHWGLEIEPLRTEIRQWLSVLKEGENPEHAKIPRIVRYEQKDSSV